MREHFEEGKIFVGGLSQETNKETMRRHFSHYGNITDSVVMVDSTSGRSRGFGFVTFDNTEAIDAVLAAKQILDGKEVDCKRASPRGSITNSSPENQDSSNAFQTDKCFVGGLPDITTDEFRNYFEQFGRVVDAILMTDRTTNRPRGFGFVTFESPEIAEEVCRNTHSHHLRGKWVEVKKATPKEHMSRGGRSSAPPSGTPYGQQSMQRNYGPQRSGSYNTYSMDRRGHGGPGGGNMYTVLGANSYGDMFPGFSGYGGESSRPRSEYSNPCNRPAFGDGYGPQIAYTSPMEPGYMEGGSRGYAGADGYAHYGDIMGSSNYNHFMPANQYPGVYPQHGPQRGTRTTPYSQRVFPY